MARILRKPSKPWHPLIPVLLCALFTLQSAHASVALLMEEPYGRFGAFNPTGHAAVYLNHICADSPTVLRPCHDGEYGVVISRYHKIDGYDWIAMPLIAYLYAVDNVNDIPSSITREQVVTTRDAYRRAHLLALAPDTPSGGIPKGEWYELVGSLFDRTIHGFQIDSTPEEDQRFIAIFNDRKNVGHFNILFHNCADFSRVVIDTYMPHAVHRNFIADVGLMTPKQVARSLVKYGKEHPEVNMTAFVMPQVPGTMPRSHPVDGVAESLIKSKKYILPLTVLAPEVAGGAVVAYLVDGRMKLPKGTPVFNIGDDANTGPSLLTDTSQRQQLTPTPTSDASPTTPTPNPAPVTIPTPTPDPPAPATPGPATAPATPPPPPPTQAPRL